MVSPLRKDLRPGMKLLMLSKTSLVSLLSSGEMDWPWLAKTTTKIRDLEASLVTVALMAQQLLKELRDTVSGSEDVEKTSPTATRLVTILSCSYTLMMECQAEVIAPI